MTDSPAQSPHRDSFWLMILCSFYLVIELIYVMRLPLLMDEFAGARQVWQLTQGIPYRDFTPYKTVLGYYIQLPGLLLTDDLFHKMIFIKLEMAVINTVCLAIVATRLARLFSGASVSIGLALLVVTSTFLERSSELRVDMLTAWLGLFSLLFLLERRIVLAAVTASLSFFVSQKGIYFCAAGAVALAVQALASRDRNDLRALLRFTTTGTAFAILYLVIFTVLASPEAVVHSTFVSPRSVALEPSYEIHHYWLQTTRRNPVFYALALIGAIVPLLVSRHRARVFLIAPFALSFFIMCAWHRQPWPYFFVFPISIGFVCVVVALEQIIPRWRKIDSNVWKATAVVLGLLLGIVLPLTRIDDNLARDNTFQASMTRLGDAILESGDRYLAGFPLVFDRDQSPRELGWVDAVRLGTLQDEASAERVQRLSDEILHQPPKFVLRNYRIVFLPEELQDAIATRFAHLWGNVYIYSPAPEMGRLIVHHDGRYVLRGSPSSSIVIDGHPLRPGESRNLVRGPHDISVIGDARLLMVPEGIESHLDPEARTERVFFPNVYVY